MLKIFKDLYVGFRIAKILNRKRRHSDDKLTAERLRIKARL